MILVECLRENIFEPSLIMRHQNELCFSMSNIACKKKRDTDHFTKKDVDTVEMLALGAPGLNGFCCMTLK